MSKKKLLTFIFFAFSLCGNTFANLDKVEVYFLSQPRVSFLNQALEKYTYSGEFQFRSIASNEEEYECVPMGDGCFHPQLGLIPLDEAKKKVDKDTEPQPIETFKTFNSEDVSLVDCKKGNYFDIFCGKSSGSSGGSVNNSKYQIWVDTSSSMKGIDYNKDADYCERRFMVTKVKNSCSKNLQVFTFDTAIKTLGDDSNLCMNYGMNDGHRMVDWMKRSKAKHLIIITDVDEYNGEFREYLNLIGAKIHGIGTVPIYASDLSSLTPKISKFCQ